MGYRLGAGVATLILRVCDHTPEAKDSGSRLLSILAYRCSSLANPFKRPLATRPDSYIENGDDVDTGNTV